MRKKLLLLSTAFATCASITFAQENPVVKDGITYSVTNTTIEYSGNIANSPSNQTSITTFDNGVGVSIVRIQTISGQKRNVILKATAIDETIAKPGQIISWSEDADQPQDGIIMDYNTNINQFGTEPDEDNGFAYEVRTDDSKYKLYVDACQKAIDYGKDLVLGSTIASGTEDTDGFEVHPALYYKVKRKKVNGTITYSYEAVTTTTGGYTETTQYLNGCVDTYYPTTIDAEVGYNVSEGKVGVVTGVVNNARMEDIIAGNARNYDFTGAIIFGEINQTVPVNKLAYFEADTKLKKGAPTTNIVVGAQCADYQIRDNGEEIYVKDSFFSSKSEYRRSFTNDTYGSIVLPFTVSSTSNTFVKQAKLTNYVASENKLTFTSAESIAPNTPYMFKVLSTVVGESTLSGAGEVVKTEEAKSQKIEGAQFVGTFEGLTAEIASQVYVIGAVGKIGRTTKALKPGRCYLTREDPDNFAKIENATIEIIDEDGSIETVKVDKIDEDVTAIDGVVNGEVVSVQYISANGQVSSEPFSGINLVKKTFEDGSVETSKVVF